MPEIFWRQLPNSLTVLRVVLAAGFFAALNMFRYPDENIGWANFALILFILAAITDALDGHLARKWRVESLFGRLMDPFCDKVLNPVSLVFKNALGEFDYFNGLAPTCPAADDLDRALGDAEEASLKEAFVYLRTGACTPPPPVDPSDTAGLRRVKSTVPPQDGWQLLLGAH